MKSSPPVTMATQKAPHVQGRVSLDISVTALAVEARPRRRRSITAMAPTTVTMAMTWIDSKVGNAQVEAATYCESGRFSTAWKNAGKIIESSRSGRRRSSARRT